jgi:hypothetical protein
LPEAQKLYFKHQFNLIFSLSIIVSKTSARAAKKNKKILTFVLAGDISLAKGTKNKYFSS